MRTPRTLAGRKAKVALLLATVAIACATATCASTGTRGGTFSIDGGLTRPMAPGVTRSLDLILTNTNDFEIDVTGIAATVQDATKKNGEVNRDCVGSRNMSVSQPFTGAVVVPANATKSLSQLGASAEQWPLLSMLDLTTNQDACKDTTFELTYTGTATG